MLSSLVKHCLSALFKFTSSFVVKLLLFRHGRCAVVCSLHLHLGTALTGWILSRCVAHLLRGTGSFIISLLLAHAALGNRGSFALNLWLLADNIEHGFLQRFLVLLKAVLLPCVIKDPSIEVVSRHALVKEANASLVVGLLLEFQSTAVLHEFFELRWDTAAEILERCLNFLLLNVGIFFVLATTW